MIVEMGVGIGRVLCSCDWSRNMVEQSMLVVH